MQPQFLVMHNSRKAQRTTTKTMFETLIFLEKCHVIVTSFQPFPLSLHIIHDRTPLLKNKLVETVQCSSSEKKEWDFEGGKKKNPAKMVSLYRNLLTEGSSEDRPASSLQSTILPSFQLQANFTHQTALSYSK